MCSRILVVEPDFLVREAIVAALERSVWVVGVGTAADALALLRRESFDVVLAEADLGRGALSSRRLFSEIGRRWPGVRRIIMSGAADARATRGPFLRKPLGGQELAILAGLEDELAAA